MKFRYLTATVLLSLCTVIIYPAQSIRVDQPLTSVDYSSTGRADCEAALSIHGTTKCLLTLRAAITGGTPPIRVKWIFSNRTRIHGLQTSLRIDAGEFIYGVCLRAIDAKGAIVLGGHWEYGINFWSDRYHAHKYAPVNVWYATIAPPCATAHHPVSFHGNVFCSSECAHSPIRSTWSFGDRTTASNDNTNHSYDRPGEFATELKATDSLGRTSTTTYPVIIIEVGGHDRN